MTVACSRGSAGRKHPGRAADRTETLSSPLSNPVSDQGERCDSDNNQWTLWDGFQTLPRPWKPLPDKGFMALGRRRKVGARRLREGPAEPETFAQETTGRLSNPGPRAIQRRLHTTEIGRLVAGYRAGQSLSDLAKEFCIHHRTVAAHLEQCGVPRRINARKFTNNDVDEAARRYRAGESLARVGNAFNVDAATVRRELQRAGITIRRRRGWN